jgi:hypothetical protein
MEELSRENIKDKTSELLNTLPFMSEFPFEEYSMTMVEMGDDLSTLGISPILLNEIGDLGTCEVINFFYEEGESDVSISIQKDDIDWIIAKSDEVKKIDDISRELKEALYSEDLLVKIKAIKMSKKFKRIIDCEKNIDISLTDILRDFLTLNSTVLHNKIKLGLQKLSEATVKSTEFSEKQFRAVTSFLNFQIHYARILLGIVIASKIY